MNNHQALQTQEDELASEMLALARDEDEELPPGHMLSEEGIHIDYTPPSKEVEDAFHKKLQDEMQHERDTSEDIVEEITTGDGHHVREEIHRDSKHKSIRVISDS